MMRTFQALCHISVGLVEFRDYLANDLDASNMFSIRMKFTNNAKVSTQNKKRNAIDSIDIILILIIISSIAIVNPFLAFLSLYFMYNLLHSLNLKCFLL